MKLSENEIASTRGVKPFFADVKTLSDYYPFEMKISERNYSTAGYRYGFGGMELDNEVKGTGNSLNTEFRFNDPRIGRWLSIDPLTRKYPKHSPFMSMDNNPILKNDPKGLETTASLEENTIKPVIDDAQSEIKYLENKIEKSLNLPEKELDGMKSELAFKQNEYNNLLVEVDELRKSSVLYDYEKSFQKGNCPIKDKYGKDLADGVTYADLKLSKQRTTIKMNVVYGASTATKAHELKHMSQFERGQTSYTKTILYAGGKLYDKTDEGETYQRARIFNYNSSFIGNIYSGSRIIGFSLPLYYTGGKEYWGADPEGQYFHNPSLLNVFPKDFEEVQLNDIYNCGGKER